MPDAHDIPPRGSAQRSTGRALRALGLLTALLLAGCGGSSETSVPIPSLPPLHPGRTGPEATFTPASSELAATGDPTARLDLLGRLGVRDIHIGIPWAAVAPNPQSRSRPTFDAADPAAYPPGGWALYDAIDRGMAVRGMHLTLALIPPAPLWATGTSAATRAHPSERAYWQPSPTEYEQFVRAVGTRYSGHYTPPLQSVPLPRLSHWSIWNEPSEGFQLAPQLVPHTQVEASGRMYRGLVDAAWSALHATGHGGDSILIGEIAPAGQTSPGLPGLFGAMVPLRFLRALYCVGTDYKPLQGTAAAQRGCPTSAAASSRFAADHPGLFAASGFANHPYPQGLAPDAVTPNEPDYTELAATGNLETALDRVNRVYGSHTRYNIYSTEFGYQTKPPDNENGVVSPQTAADWMNWAEYITWSDPRQVSFDQYLISDPTTGNFATGLLTAAGAPKPAFAAYRMPIFLPATATRRGHPLVVWGCVRPARGAQLHTHHAQRVEIQFAPAATTAFRTVKRVIITSVHGYFESTDSFPGTGTVRLRWTDPSGAVMTSRTVAVRLR